MRYLTRSAASVVIWNSLAIATPYFAAASGNDSGPGSLSRPWKTLGTSAGKLNPGDTLYLRDGVYNEGGIVINKSGTAAAPIVIRGYPGEHPVIDPGVQKYGAPNSEWELADESLKLYKSKTRFEHMSLECGVLKDIGDVQLITYQDMNYLKSTNYEPKPDEFYYAGPGIVLSGGYLYIRLVPNPIDTKDFQGTPLTYPDPAPNKCAIMISGGSAENTVTIAANYVKIQGLKLYSLQRVFGASGVHHVEISNCTIVHKKAAMRIVGGNNLDFHHNFCTFGFPDWVYWLDVKAATKKPAYEAGWNSFSFNADNLTDSRIDNNVWYKVFDGVYLTDGCQRLRVNGNLFFNSRDDALQFQAATGNIEAGYNVFRHCHSSISTVANGSNTGPIYLHHNVLNQTWKNRWVRPTKVPTDKRPQLGWGKHWAGHGCPCNTSHFRVYNNHFIAFETYKNNFDPVHGYTCFTNNLLLEIGDHVYKPDPSKNAGNLYWRTQGGLTNFAEPQALEIDPGIGYQALGSRTLDVQEIWNQNLPSNAGVFTAGASVDAAWPGGGCKYRGAVPPGGYTVEDGPVPTASGDHGVKPRFSSDFASAFAVERLAAGRSRTFTMVDIAAAGEMEGRLFDMNGRLVGKFVKRFPQPGRYRVDWEMAGTTRPALGSGIRLVTLRPSDSRVRTLSNSNR